MANGARYDIIVVGGGIAGLTAAWRLRDRNVLVLEAAEIVGGRLRTVSRPPYWLNLGAHVLMAEGPMATLAAEVGVALTEPPGNFLAVAMHGRVARAGNVASMFLRLPLSPAGRISLARTGLKLLMGKRRDPAKLESMSFREFLGPMHPDVEALMRVVANRLTGELDDISALVGINGFDHLWLGSRLNIAGGSAELPFTLARKLGDRVVTGAKVTRVYQTAAEVSVDYERNGERLTATADFAIVAVPAPSVSGLVADLSQNQARALAAMRYTPFLVAGIFTNETGPMPWDDLYALATPDKSFCMFFNPGNALRRGPRQPGGAVVIYAVADRATALMQRRDDEIRALYLNDLYAVFPSARGAVSEVIIQRWQHGTAMGYSGRAANLATLAEGHGRISFAGDYLMPIDGVDATESGANAAGWVRHRIGH
jgi:oxygen-dependent protoporphyrinogen oxidase